MSVTHMQPRDLSHPAAVIKRLEDLDAELAVKQNEYETAALDWFRAKRDRERDRALSFLSAAGTVAERNAVADRETATTGADAEARYEAVKAYVRVLETRANIGMALLKSQGRA